MVKQVAENFFESQWDNENCLAALGDDNDNQIDTEDDGLDLNINLSPIVNQKVRRSLTSRTSEVYKIVNGLEKGIF